MEWFITIGFIIFLYLIGKYTIEEGHKSEQQKKFLKDLEEFDKKYKAKTK